MGIPGAHLSEEHASVLCMLGSLEDIASCGVDGILESIDVSPAQCVLPLAWPSSESCQPSWYTFLVCCCQCELQSHMPSKHHA